MRELNEDGTDPVEEAEKAHKKEVVGNIAKSFLGIQTLQVRNRDSLDFHDVGVASLEAALIAAYELGQKEA
jgi:hypothetical protein